MIPAFDHHAYLARGIHTASLEAIEARFGGTSDLWGVQMESLHWLAELAEPASMDYAALGFFFVDFGRQRA